MDFLLEPARHDPRAVGPGSRYIVCSEDKNFSHEACLGFAAKLGVNVETIDAGHDVMLSRPAELANLLVKRDIF